MNSNASIGYFGVPGCKSGQRGMTHMVVGGTDAQKALCGTRFSPFAEYQWCFPSWRHGDPECPRCKKIKFRMWEDELSAARKANPPVKKAKMAVHFASATNEWETPPELFARINALYNFTLDPCCTKETAKCAKYFTAAENGLTQSWKGHRVFCNPPYSRGEQAKWIKKAYEESLEGALVVLLIPSRTDTKVWHDYCMKGDIKFIKGRVKFRQDKRILDSAPFPNALVVFNSYGKNSRKMGSFVL